MGRKAINIVGQKFGKLTVIERTGSKNKDSVWKCKCDCGNVVYVSKSNLLHTTNSCGCLQKELLSKRTKKNYIGKKFNMLTVISESGRTNDGQVLWKCQCDCGNFTTIRTTDLKNIKSCGCLKHKYKDLTGKKFGKLTILEFDHINHCAYWKARCECGNVIVSPINSLQNRTYSCGCVNSKGNSQIYSILQNRNINFKREYSFSDLKLIGPLSFDFAIFDTENNLICLIEYQGIQHFVSFGEFGKQQREITDLMKFNYCKEKNINLFYITYQQNLENELEKILKKYNL